MKRLMMWIAALVTLSLAVVHAQDVTGTWQGTLQAGRPLRVVIKISNADGAGLQAVMYSIDQGGQALAGTISVQGTAVKIAIAAIGGSHEGKLSVDGNAIAGTLTQGGMPYGKPDEPVRPVPLISQETLADMIGTTRLGFIAYTGGLNVNNSLLTVVLHD